jgi:hypothetical protein
VVNVTGIRGPMTVRAGKDGYSDWTGSWFMRRDVYLTAHSSDCSERLGLS